MSTGTILISDPGAAAPGKWPGKWQSSAYQNILSEFQSSSHH